MSHAGKTLLAVVPARGGSKGVPRKNIRPLGGRPLIAWTGEVVRALPEIDRAVVSTDDDGIATAAEACGLAAPFRRPEALSGDRIGDREVLAQALEEMERIDGRRYDAVLMLQPTCPLRTPGMVRACWEKLVAEGRDAVWTVSATDLKFHPLKQLTVGPEGMRWYDPAGAGIVARQQLAPVYHRNGACYALARECLLGQKTILGRNSAAVIVEEPLVNIDTLEDFARAERVLLSR